jgi:hypothetical protein
MRFMAGQPGSVPGMSAHYNGAIAVSGQGTVVEVKAVAVKSGMTNSTVTNGTFTIDNSVSKAKWGTGKWNPWSFISRSRGARFLPDIQPRLCRFLF